MAEADAVDGPWAKYGALPEADTAPWQKYGGAPAQEAQDEAPKPFMGMSERFEHGLGDLVYGGSQLGIHAFPFLGGKEQIDKIVSDREAAYNAKKSASGFTGTDWSRILGNIFGSAPLAAVAGAAEAPQSMMGAIGQGAGQGAIQAAVAPVTDQGHYWGDKGTQVAAGAGTGALAAPLTYGLAKLLNPTVSPEVSLLQSKGVTPTAGQLGGGGISALEDKITSIPGVGDIVKMGQNRAVRQFNTASLNEALAPIKESLGTDEAQVGREGLKAVADKLGASHDRILPNLKVSLRGDEGFVGDIGKAMDMVAGSDAQQKLESTITHVVAPRISADGTMSGEVFKQMEEELTKRISRYGAAGGDDGLLADGLDQVLTAFRGNMQRSNPEFAEQLAATNKGWALHSALRRAVAGTNNAEGVFTPNQLWSALRGADTTAGKSATAYGTGGDLQDLAKAGLGVLGNKYPDSGTAGRAIAAGLLGGAPSLAMAAGAHPLATAAAAVPVAGLLAYTPAGQRVVSNLFSQRVGALGPALSRIIQESGAPLRSAGVAALLSP